MPRGGVRLTLRQGCNIIAVVCCRSAEKTRAGNPDTGLPSAEASPAMEVYHVGYFQDVE